MHNIINIPVTNDQTDETMHGSNQPMNNTTTPPVTNHQTSRTVRGLKKSCKTCIGRKIKCVVMEGSDPKICERCEEKGLACEFEAKKPYVRTKP
jgi:hypothetical protein